MATCQVQSFVLIFSERVMMIFIVCHRVCECV